MKDIITKCDSYFATKCGKELLQKVFLSQVFKKCKVYYKMRRYTDNKIIGALTTYFSFHGYAISLFHVTYLKYIAISYIFCCTRVCMCVCVCVCVCVCTSISIHREGFICLDQLEYQRTYQRCIVVDVTFLCLSLHHCFRMKHQTFLIGHFILLTH